MRVLVAEDHLRLARSIAEGLRDEGYAVDLAFTGDEAIHLAKMNEYDCVLLDIMLPGKDGWTILSELRSDDRNVPVLCLTAKDTVDDRVRGLNLGADDYLVKPFDWEELRARVRAVIRRRHESPTSVFQIADLKLDAATKSVERGGQRIELSAKEYALLEYMAHRKGKVVSRAEIWEHLYDQTDEIKSNVVDVYIGYLRKKIDRGQARKLIHTRRGHGYMLAEAS